jgi:sugar/nucleoside kinase (ribokinase family)
MAKGPKHVIIKKGENGAYMFNAKSIFFAPAYPLESVFDPTGAGDSFAGGFFGYLSRTGDLGEGSMRRAVVCGCAMGSFAVERFSVDRFFEITEKDLTARIEEFRKLVAFEKELVP